MGADAETQARSYGSPGERARFAGIVRAAWPLFAAVFLCGGLIGVALPGPRLSSAGLGIGLLLLAGTLLGVGAGTGRRRIEAFFKGAQGEEAVSRVLARLPAGYHVFHGVDLGAAGWAMWRGSDLDHVVVGPAGICAVETKNWRGRITLAGDELHVDGRTPSRPPVRQARAAAAQLSAWLAVRTGHALPVRAILCFAGQGQAEPALTAGEVSVCSLDRLVETVQAGGRALAAADTERAVKVLENRLRGGVY